MKTNKILILSLAIMTIVAITFSCKKKKDTIGKVTVYNGNNEVVSDCRVVMWGKASPDSQGQGNVVVYDTAYTNESGEATFYFNKIYQLGQSGVAILNIEARKGNLKGEGIIKIVEQEINTQKVFIHP